MAPPPSLKALERRTALFLKTERPVLELQLPGEYLRSGRAALLDPNRALPQSAHFPYRALAALYRYATTCEAEALESARSAPQLQKAVRFHQYRCSSSAPPKGFFLKPPFMHPSGRSFVAMAGLGGRLTGFVHLRELGSPNEPQLALLSRLPDRTLRMFLARSAAILSPRYLFLAGSTLGEAPTRKNIYRVYRRATWIASTGFVPVERSSKQCAVAGAGAIAGVCFAPPRRSALHRGGLAAALSILFASVFGLLWSWGAARRRDREERLFVLRTLTHEIRTPVTALKLSLEPLRIEFDQLSENGQVAFLQVADQVNRLARVVTSSAAYLSSERAGGPARELIHSFQAYLSSVLVQFEGVRILPLEQDLELRSDPRWLAIALRNLVENAVLHGEPPVEVLVKRAERSLEIHVRDGGRLANPDLQKLTAPFQRDGAKEGLGLGLAIVARIAQKLGGRLLVQVNPTTFILRVPKDEKDPVDRG